MERQFFPALRREELASLLGFNTTEDLATLLNHPVIRQAMERYVAFAFRHIRDVFFTNLNDGTVLAAVRYIDERSGDFWETDIPLPAGQNWDNRNEVMYFVFIVRQHFREHPEEWDLASLSLSDAAYFVLEVFHYLLDEWSCTLWDRFLLICMVYIDAVARHHGTRTREHETPIFLERELVRRLFGAERNH